MYLSGAIKPSMRPYLEAGTLGGLYQPSAGQGRHGGVWAADNGCFNADTYLGDDAWMTWLKRQTDHLDTCLFAVAPDVVGDHDATLARSLPWLPQIRALGYKAAFVGQDGAAIETVPWDEFDVLFIGGSTDFKLGAVARGLVAHARALGKDAHMGRVNSEKRLRYAKHIGCTSADGTFIAFGPDVNLPRVLSWLRGVNDQLDLYAEETPSSTQPGGCKVSAVYTPTHDRAEENP